MNDDSINRQAAMRTVKTIYKMCDTGDMRDYRDLMSEAIEALPSAEPGWIPCSERRPLDEINPHTMDYKLYVCSCDFGDSKDVRVYKYGDGHFWNGPGMVDEYVVAWMPLPKPWEGGLNE